jgi:hypothetical protein
VGVNYTAAIIKPQDLSIQQRESMVKLYLSHYDASNRELFFSDLHDKTEVMLVLDGHRLAGFTTIANFLWRDGEQTLNIVYSGDTIVDPVDWGQQTLAFAWIRRMGELKREHPDLSLYWLLIVKGHRTFKYLPTFGKTFFPHWRDSNDDLGRLAARLAGERFGDNYNPQTGVIELSRSRGQLRADIAEPTEAELRKECVRFFLEKNPNYRIGHELVCLCSLEESNMKPMTRRLFNKAEAA